MESISFCRRKFDAIPFCREMQRRYLAVPKINPKSSDAECSAAPKKRFYRNVEPLLFCCFRKRTGRDSNSSSGRFASRPVSTVLRTVEKSAGESPASAPQHIHEEILQKRRTSSFFVVPGSGWEGTRTAAVGRQSKEAWPASHASFAHAFSDSVCRTRMVTLVGASSTLPVQGLP